MQTLSNRILLIASYCLLSVNMAIDVVVHPGANAPLGGIPGLTFCLTLVALLWNMPLRWNQLVTVLNGLGAAGGAFIIGQYVYSHGAGWADVPALLVRVYLNVVVPIAAVCYFITRERQGKAVVR